MCEFEMVSRFNPLHRREIVTKNQPEFFIYIGPGWFFIFEYFQTLTNWKGFQVF